MKAVNLNTEIDRVRVECHLASHSEALELFRSTFYKDFDVKLVHNPTVQYNTSKDTYVVSYAIFNGQKVSFKCENAVAKFMAKYLDKTNCYFGFKLNSDAVVVDCVIEEY